MNSAARQFAVDLVASLLNEQQDFSADPYDSARLLATCTDGKAVSLDLTPVVIQPQPVTAASWFQNVRTAAELIEAYIQCKSFSSFEIDLPKAAACVDSFATIFLDQLISRARTELTDNEACVIAEWVANFDVYIAVKAIESLLNSRADRVLLCAAEAQEWVIYMDHVAIRCGSNRHESAHRITVFLCDHYGYSVPTVEEEAFYQFQDGWNARPVYKMLDNGLMLRVFTDESAQDHPEQIIQHWNHVYGYTAHHLALRACRYTDGCWSAVGLAELISVLAQSGINTLTPTGEHTLGLLEQAFAQPSHTPDIPNTIKQALSLFGAGLEQTIENGKLIELVSRREMSPEFAQRYFNLYGICYEPANPLHSAPVYTYFLPAQAAHVIRTSQEIV